MFMFFFGLLILTIGALGYRISEFIGHHASKFKVIGLGIALLGIFNASLKTIEAGSVGVATLFGKVESQYMPNGLHLINPMMKVIVFNSKTQNYTMSAVHDEGDKSGDDAIRILSADGLEVVLDVTVLFKVVPSKTPVLYQQIGTDYINNIVRPISRTKIRDNAVYYTAIDLYSGRRDEFQARIFKGISSDFASRGLLLEQVLVRNITLPATVRSSIESKIQAEQESQKMQFVLAKERQEADRKRVEAQGISDYQRIVNDGLSDKLLQYEMIKAQKELALSPNSKVVIMGGGKTAPILIGQ